MTKDFREFIPAVGRIYEKPRNADGSLLYGVVVDQFPSLPQNRGVSGLPASDITLLSRAKSQLEVDALMSRLKDYSEQSAKIVAANKDKSLKQLMAEVRRRCVQTPAELAQFEEYLASIGSDFVKKPSDETNNKQNETNNKQNETNSQNDTNSQNVSDTSATLNSM